jgi:hypothetical protein
MSKKLVIGITIIAAIVIASFVVIPLISTSQEPQEEEPVPFTPSIPVLMVDSVTSNTGNINLYWTLTPDVIGVDIYRSNGGEFSTTSVKIKSLEAGIIEYIDTVNEGTWNYAIIMKYILGDSIFSNIVSVIVTLPHEPEPTGPEATTLNEIPYTSNTGIISLSWYIAESVTGTDIYRSSENFVIKEQATKITTIEGKGNTYVDTVSNGMYYYAVIVKNMYVESPLSNIISINVQIPHILQTPTLNNIPASSETGTIILTWGSDPSILYTRVLRYNALITNKIDPTLIGTVSIGINTYTDTVGLGTWYYAIYNVDAFGESDLSNVVSVTVVAPAPTPDQILAFWRSWYPGQTFVLSTVTFIRTSFSPLPSLKGTATGGVKSYSAAYSNVNTVVPGASKAANTWTVSANGLAVLKYDTVQGWLLYTR